MIASGATLVLTGHYHGGYIAKQSGRPIFAYPGSPEPIKFGEKPTHGALLVTVTGKNVDVRAMPIARTRLIESTCDLSGVGNENAAFSSLERALVDYGRNDYLRLRLCGDVAPGTRLDTTLMEERFGGALGSLSIEDDTIAYDYASIAREPTVRGHVVRDLLGREEDRAALKYALAAFEGTDIAP